MNSLSWFLYLIDVISSAKGLAIAGVIFCIAGICAVWAICAMGLDSLSYSERQKDEGRATEIRATRKTLTKRLLIGAAISAVVWGVLPYQSTMYAIAASQVGEQIAKSETVRGLADDATKALQQWIKRQIEPEKKS